MTKNPIKLLRLGLDTLWAIQAWPAWRLGYLTALDDVQSGRVVPSTDANNQIFADIAFHRQQMDFEESL